MLILDGLMLTVVRLLFPSLGGGGVTICFGVPLLPYRSANPSDKTRPASGALPSRSSVIARRFILGSYTSSPRAQSRFLRPEFRTTFISS
jgi:hypothetical protein